VCTRIVIGMLLKLQSETYLLMNYPPNKKIGIKYSTDLLNLYLFVYIHIQYIYVYLRIL